MLNDSLNQNNRSLVPGLDLEQSNSTSDVVDSKDKTSNNENGDKVSELENLENEFKRGVSEYKLYNYSEALEIFSLVLDNSLSLNQIDTHKNAAKYLAKLFILKGNYETAIIYLRKLDTTPQTLNLLVRCYLLEYEKTNNKRLLNLSKHILLLILSRTEGSNYTKQMLNEDDDLNFAIKNNLLLSRVCWELEDYVSYFNLVDKIDSIINGFCKEIKNKHLINYSKIRSLSSSNKIRDYHAIIDSSKYNTSVVKEVENKFLESVLDFRIDMVTEISKNIFNNELILNLDGGTVKEILVQLIQFYSSLEVNQPNNFYKILSLNLNINELDLHHQESFQDVAINNKRVQYTRHGQRDVKRRVIASEGASTKSVYLKNYWISVCNFFYLSNFNNQFNNQGTISGLIRRDSEEEPDPVGTIYPSDIAKYLRYSESYYNLKLIMKLGFKEKQTLSEMTSFSLLTEFLKRTQGLNLTLLSFSLKLLEFLLKSHRIGSCHETYLLLISHLYVFIHNALTHLETSQPNSSSECEEFSKVLLVNLLYKYNNLFSSKSEHVKKFKWITIRYGIRMLFLIDKSNSSSNKQSSMGKKVHGSDYEMVNRAYYACLFFLYKLCNRDYFKRIHVLYFHVKKLSNNKLDLNDYICQMMRQYNYALQYKRNGRSLNPLYENSRISRSYNGFKKKKTEEYLNKLMNNIANISLDETNLETELERFIKKFYILLSKQVDISIVSYMFNINNGDEYVENFINQVSTTHESYLNSSYNKSFLNELRDFLVEITCVICRSERIPAWTETLLLFLGDILSVLSFNLHKNITNIQLNESFNFFTNLPLDSSLLAAISSSVLTIINKLYYYKYQCKISLSEKSSNSSDNFGTEYQSEDGVNPFINCLKEVELVNGFSLALKNIISRLYSNIVFIIYHLVNYLICDYNNPDSKLIYFLYITFAQVVIIILSSFFNIDFYTNNTNDYIMMDVPFFLSVNNENTDSKSDSESVDAKNDDLQSPMKVISTNMMDYYYTYNNILESFLQIDFLFKENDLSLDHTLIPSKLGKYLSINHNGIEFSDSPININLGLSSTIFNKLTHLFNHDLLKSVDLDLQIINNTNHLLNDEYLIILSQIYHNFECLNNNSLYICYYEQKQFSSKRSEYDKNKVNLLLDKNVISLTHELSNKCMNSVIGKEFTAPVVSLFYIHYKKYENIDNQLYIFVNLLNQMSMPNMNNTPLFKLYPNPLMLSFDKKESGDNNSSNNNKVCDQDVKTDSMPPDPSINVDNDVKNTNTVEESKKQDECPTNDFDPKFLDYLSYVKRIENVLDGPGTFDYKEIETVYDSHPEYEFMYTHKRLYLKILSNFSGIDAITTFDIESFNPEYLVRHLEVINMAGVIMPRSYDVLFLAVVKKFELFLSILDVKPFHFKYSFYDMQFSFSSLGPGSGPSTYNLELSNLIKTLLYLIQLAINKYDRLVSGVDMCEDNNMIFYGQYACLLYKKDEIEEENSYSFRLNNRVKLLYFIRIMLFAHLLKTGGIIPLRMLLNDYYLLTSNMSSSLKIDIPTTSITTIENLLSFMPCTNKILDNQNYLYLLYIQIKILERIIKDVSIDNHLWKLIYCKIMVSYKHYLQILVHNKGLELTDGDGDGDEDAKNGSLAKPNGELTMNELNQIFLENFDSGTMDDEMIIVYYKLYCAALRLCYMRPPFYYILPSFSFSPKYNSLFENYSPLLDNKREAEWLKSVESQTNANNIKFNDVVGDIISFFERIKNSTDSDIGCMVCYKLAVHYFNVGDVGKSIAYLEEMTTKIFVPNDYVRFAINFEITFIKSCRKIITNLSKMVIHLTCQEVRNAKFIQDDQTLNFNHFYLQISDSYLLKNKFKNKVKNVKKGPGNWIFSGIKCLQRLDNIHKLIEVLMEILKNMNRKFKNITESDKCLLFYSTLNHGQTMIINTLTYCFTLMVYACPHVLSLSAIYPVLDLQDLISLAQSQKVVIKEPNYVNFMTETLYSLITTNPGVEDVYEYLENKGIFHHSSISSEYNILTATVDMRILKQLYTLLNLKLFLKPVEITNKLSDIFIDACNRLLYFVPTEPESLTNVKDILLSSGQIVKISDDWVLNQRITTIQKATSAFNEASNKQD